MRASIFALLSCLALTACGQKGPLYLPQDPAAQPATTATHGSAEASKDTADSEQQ